MKFILICFILTTTTAHASVFVESMQCQKVFGNPVFKELIFTFATKTEGDWTSDRTTKIMVAYTHSGLDKDYYTKPFQLTTTAYQAKHESMVKIKFSDDRYGTRDYSGGTITFAFDDDLGILALIDYVSDGKDLFGILACNKWPEIVKN